MKLLVPVDISNVRVSQDFDEHVNRAKRNGWCYQPGYCPGGIYYYGGIDFAYLYDKNPPIYVATSGVVSRVKSESGGYGNYIYIKHDDGSLTVYAHLNSTTVAVGDRVNTGDIIAYGGNTGNSTAPHLHFEFRNSSGIPVDPQPYFESPQIPIDPDSSDNIKFEIPEEWHTPQICITAVPFLRVRPQPSTSGYWNPNDKIHTGGIADVIEVSNVTNGEVWLKIGHNQYCAAVYNGYIYAEWIEE